MRIAPFLEGFAVRRQDVPVRSAQVVQAPAYIRGALRTTRPTSFGSGYADLGTDAPYLGVHGEGKHALSAELLIDKCDGLSIMESLNLQ